MTQHNHPVTPDMTRPQLHDSVIVPTCLKDTTDRHTAKA